MFLDEKMRSKQSILISNALQINTCLKDGKWSSKQGSVLKRIVVNLWTLFYLSTHILAHKSFYSIISCGNLGSHQECIHLHVDEIVTQESLYTNKKNRNM